MTTCVHCRAPLNPGARVCASCGRAQRRSRLALVGGFVAGFVILAALGAALGMGPGPAFLLALLILVPSFLIISLRR